MKFAEQVKHNGSVLVRGINLQMFFTKIDHISFCHHPTLFLAGQECTCKFKLEIVQYEVGYWHLSLPYF
jgi:hypothetical protein